MNIERSIGLDFLFTITLFAPKLDIVGDTPYGPYGKRIIANVDSGHFEGPNIKETVQPPTGDWLLIRAVTSVQLDACVSLVTDDNTLIYISYQGLRAGQQSVLDRLAVGEDVDPRDYYMRTICRFETADGKYDWLNQLLTAGTGQRFPDRVVYDIHQII